MSKPLQRLRLALAADDADAAVDAALDLDVELVFTGRQNPTLYSDVLAILKTLHQPQSRVGQTLVNIFQAHWDRVPVSVLADARSFCAAASAEFVDAGAHQAMVELASGEWPGHVRASDV